jgi:hypothetical protein
MVITDEKKFLLSFSFDVCQFRTGTIHCRPIFVSVGIRSSSFISKLVEFQNVNRHKTWGFSCALKHYKITIIIRYVKSNFILT